MKRSISAFVVVASVVGSSWLATASVASAEQSKTPGDPASQGACEIVIGTPAAEHLPGQGYTAIKNHC